MKHTKESQNNEYKNMKKKNANAKIAAGAAAAVAVEGVAVVLAEDLFESDDEAIEVLPETSDSQANEHDHEEPVLADAVTAPVEQHIPQDVESDASLTNVVDGQETENIGDNPAEITPEDGNVLTSPLRDDVPVLSETAVDEEPIADFNTEEGLADANPVMDVDTTMDMPDVSVDLSQMTAPVQDVVIEPTPISVQEIDTTMEMPNVGIDLTQVASTIQELVLDPIKNVLIENFQEEDHADLAVDWSDDDQDVDTSGHYKFDNVGVMQDESGNDIAFAEYHTETGFMGRMVDTDMDGEFDKIMDVSGTTVLADAPEHLTVADAHTHVLGAEHSYLDIGMDLAQNNDFENDITNTSDPGLNLSMVQ